MGDEEDDLAEFERLGADWNSLPEGVRDYGYALITRLMVEAHQREVENELRLSVAVSASAIEEHAVIARAQQESMSVTLRVLRRLDERYCPSCGHTHENEEPHAPPLDPKKLS